MILFSYLELLFIIVNTPKHIFAFCDTNEKLWNGLYYNQKRETVSESC